MRMEGSSMSQSSHEARPPAEGGLFCFWLICDAIWFGSAGAMLGGALTG